MIAPVPVHCFSITSPADTKVDLEVGFKLFVLY